MDKVAGSSISPDLFIKRMNVVAGRLDSANSQGSRQGVDISKAGSSISKDDLQLYKDKHLDPNNKGTFIQVVDWLLSGDNFNTVDINNSGKISLHEAKKMMDDQLQVEQRPAEAPQNPPRAPGPAETPTRTVPSTKPKTYSSPQVYGEDRLKAFGYKDIPGAPGAQINYIKAPNGYTNPELSVDPSAKYLLIVTSSGGHDNGNYKAHSPIDPSWTNIPEGMQDRVVGWVGSKDKGMMLVDVSGLDTIKFKGRNETEIAWISVPSDKKLVIDNAASSKSIDGALDPQLGRQDVKASSSSDFAIYAEDEGTAGARVDNLRQASLYLDGGDNSLLVLTQNESINLTGNGAIAQIRMVNN